MRRGQADQGRDQEEDSSGEGRSKRRSRRTRDEGTSKSRLSRSTNILRYRESGDIVCNRRRDVEDGG